jgi:hypothetical protein
MKFDNSGKDIAESLGHSLRSVAMHGFQGVADVEPVYDAVNRCELIRRKHNRKHKMMDQVFRFQDPDALVDRLEAQTENGDSHKISMPVSVRTGYAPRPSGASSKRISPVAPIHIVLVP